MYWGIYSVVPCSDKCVINVFAYMWRIGDIISRYLLMIMIVFLAFLSLEAELIRLSALTHFGSIKETSYSTVRSSSFPPQPHLVQGHPLRITLLLYGVCESKRGFFSKTEIICLCGCAN